MNVKPRFLISFLHHRVNDGRVFYREVRHILNSFGDEIEVVAIHLNRREQMALVELEECDLVCDGFTVHCYQICVPERCSILNKVRWKLLARDEVYRLLERIKPDLYLIADVREIPAAVKLHKNHGTPMIYDSHEDYVRQALDYGKTAMKYFRAALYNYYEKKYINYFEAVFCTDEFLEKKYKQSIYRAKKVYLLRNFPYCDTATKNLSRKFFQCDILRMVYIGGIDPYRGVIEAAQYVKKYNEENKTRKIKLDIYGSENAISKSVSDGTMVISHGWTDHKELMGKLRNDYDVGVSLLLPIPKFFTNLPIKNFDYMGAGLPFLTSNFGNLKYHAERSKAGICIDPKNYEEFKTAVEKLFDPCKREELSANGLKYVREDAAFQTEAIPLIASIKEILKLQ